MNPVKLFIDRPIMTTLVMVAILLFGITGYLHLPVNDLPNVDFPTISVSAGLPGANPDTMAASVATPLEQQFSSIDGLDSMTSTSSLGSSQITLQFDLDRNLDAAAQDVQAAISTAQRKLPDDMPAPPSLRKVNPADAPILFLSLTSDVLPLSDVNEYAEKQVSQRLSMVKGVAQVNVFGAQRYAVRVQLNPDSLTSRHIGIDEVATAIRQGNVNLPVGTLFAEDRTYTLTANGQLMDAAAFQNLIIAYRNGAPVYLRDVAKVIDSIENSRSASWFNDKRAVVLAIQRQPGVNTIQVINELKAQIPDINRTLPPAVNLSIMFDRSTTIRNSINEIQFTLILTVVLVVLVIYLFLGSLSATVISSLALPMSIIGTFAVIALLGFSLNNLSLMALTLSVGFVVDDAIVVLENIIRHLEMGKSRLQASIEGGREIGFTILSMTLSLVAVFIPILFMGGLVGRLFNEFAVTIAVAILVSGLVSLTLTPMLCSLFLREHGQSAPNRIIAWSDKAFAKTTELYDWTLRVVLGSKPIVFVAFLLSLVVTGWLFMIVPKGFLPSEDTGQLNGSIEAQQGVPFPDMVRYRGEVAKIVMANSNVQSVMTSVDSGNNGRVTVVLKPHSERHDSAETVIQQLRPKFAKIPGIRVFLQNPPSIRLGGRVSKSLYQFTMQGPDSKALQQATQALEVKMREIPGLLDVTSDLQITNPQLTIDIDREKASSLGLTVSQIEDALANTFSTRQISTIYTSSNDYQVITELAPESQRDINALSAIYIRTTANQLVPLNAVAKVTRTVGPLSVSHSGQFPSTTLSFNLQPGVSLGDKVHEIERIARETLPSSVSSAFQGSAQAFQGSQQGLGLLLIVAVLVIYIILGILYESFIHPLTILSGLPSAILGGLATLILFGQDLNLYGFLGLILLIGIVKKNAIMMIDFALETQRHENKTPEEAIYIACLTRFRPIMMTTIAALMGTLPIAIGFGEGADARRSLGLAVFGGLMVSQLLTLYITPVLYVYMDRLKNFLSGHKRRDERLAHETI